jgi:hypothetical protein
LKHKGHLKRQVIVGLALSSLIGAIFELRKCTKSRHSGGTKKRILTILSATILEAAPLCNKLISLRSHLLQIDIIILSLPVNALIQRKHKEAGKKSAISDRVLRANVLSLCDKNSKSQKQESINWEKPT